MTSIILSILPVFCIILLGAFFKKIHMPGDQFWPLAEKITYYVLLPCLFFKSVATANFSEININNILAAIILPPLIIAVIVITLKTVLSIRNDTLSSVMQGSVRFNNYIGIPSALALQGQLGLTISAIIIALLVPLTTAIAVVSLNILGNNTKNKSLSKNLLNILSNPLIIACALGYLINISGVQLITPIMSIIDTLSKSALAFGLLIVGASLDIKSIRNQHIPITITAILKLLVQPSITLGFCIVWNIDTNIAQILVLYSALPAASSCYILAKQLGGDAKVMSNITVIEVMLSMITIPIMLTLTAHLLM